MCIRDRLLGEAEVTEQGKASKLDVRMKFLEESSPLGALSLIQI